MSMLALLAVAATASDGPSLWGALGCAVAYAGAVLAGVDGISDFVLQRGQHTDPREQRALSLKMGSKVAASLMTVVTAGIILVLDSNWFAFGMLSIAFVAILVWVFVVYRAKGANAESP